METGSTAAPSVVSVMVVHEPGDWFDETLRGLASQDYPNLRTLFLLTPTTDEPLVRDTIMSYLPSAFVRVLPDNASFGANVDYVARLVEGDNGFFLISHDDTAMSHDAVRRMVEELFRSNAGIVGPKLVDWDHPRVLQHVGVGLDRLGEVDPLIEPGETDQEQHDAVRDVFVIPSACMLVRADLFRALGGFDPSITFYGDDVELCWRAHLTGARVVVVPDARVRHRERLAERRPDLNERVLASRHRMRTVATLTGGSRLIVRSFQMLVATLVELVVGVFTGRVNEAFASLRALIGLIPRTPALLARRRAVAPIRNVTEDDVLALQVRGSARLSSYMRSRETATYVQDGATVRRWREATLGPLLMWALVLLGLVVGSRRFIRDAVPLVGEFLPLPASPRGLWSAFLSAFDHRSFGAVAPNPTGYATLAVSSFATLFHNGLLFTALVVGLPLIGAIGLWQLASVFPNERARISATVVYLAAPLVPHLLGTGDFTALVVFGALPWLVHLSRLAAGIRTADPSMESHDLTDAITSITTWERVRYLAGAALVLAAAVSLAPATLTIWLFTAFVIALGSLIAAASWRVAMWFVVAGVGASATAFVLNLPWSSSLRAADWFGHPVAGPAGRSLVETLSMSSSSVRFGFLGLALYLPVLAAVAIGRAWRLTWAIRGLGLVMVAATLVVVIDRGGFSGAIPSAELLSIPLVLGLAIGGGALSGGLGIDVFQRDFGWRQPLAVVAGAALVVGLVPTLLAVGSGRWGAPVNTTVEVLESLFPDSDGPGDYRVLYLGDASMLPAPGHPFRDGIEWVVLDRGPIEFTSRFAPPNTDGDVVVTDALNQIASGGSLRAGRLLAPLGIRFVVIPAANADAGLSDDPQVPDGLTAALDQQLDLGVAVGPPTLFIYENAAWLPVGAALGPPVVSAVDVANVDELVTVDFKGATPVLPGVDRRFGGPLTPVPVGQVHLGIPFSDALRLDVDGQALAPRRDFGVTTVFDVPTAGGAQVTVDAGGGRAVVLVLVTILWLVVFSLAAGLGARLARRTRGVIDDDTLIDLDDDEFVLDEGIWASELDAPLDADAAMSIEPTEPELVTWADEEPAFYEPADDRPTHDAEVAAGDARRIDTGRNETDDDETDYVDTGYVETDYTEVEVVEISDEPIDQPLGTAELHDEFEDVEFEDDEFELDEFEVDEIEIDNSGGSADTTVAPADHSGEDPA